jgi:acetyl esterase/lipase
LNGKNPDDSLISPIIAKDFLFFPPALIVTSEHDVLKPQGTALFDKLKLQGVKVKTVDIKNKGHLGGYWAAAHPNAEEAITETVNFILKGSGK